MMLLQDPNYINECCTLTKYLCVENLLRRLLEHNLVGLEKKEAIIN